MHGHMLSRSEERLIRGLHRRKVRQEEGLFLAEGIRVVEDLVESDLPLRLAVVSPSAEESERGRELVRSLEERCPVRRVSEPELAALAATETPQGVLAVAEIPRQDLAALRIEGAAAALVLDGVQDPGNFGTLVRTADALGAAFVAALPGTVDPWNPKSVRSAAGAAFRVPIVQPTPEELFEWLHERGFTMYGADMSGAPVDRVELAQRAALVVGNEGAGLSPTALQAVDGLLAVPIKGHAESLNVAIAAGILLFFLTRRG